MSRRNALLMVCWALFSLFAPPTAAQNQTEIAVDREANRLFGEIMSPFCPGRTLATCPSPQAAELQDEIKVQLQAGATADDIWEGLYAVYGDQVRSVPRASGFNLLAWAIPALFFLLGTAVLIRRISRPVGEAASSIDRADGLDSELKARLDRELAEIESLT
jgi:cytochrome c-type biogenesis protein CcmH/NrfF